MNRWLNVKGVLVLCAALFVLGAAVPASAAPDAGAAKLQPAKKAPAGDYKPWTPPKKEQVSAPLFVVLAYSAIWLTMLAFVLSVWARQRRVERELAELIREQQE